MRWILSLCLGIGPISCVRTVSDPSLPTRDPVFAARVVQASQALGLQPITDLDQAHLATWDGTVPGFYCSSFADWVTAKLAARAPEPQALRVPNAPPQRRQDDALRRPLGLDQPQLTDPDRLSIRFVQTALASIDTRRALFQARDLDLEDRTSEWGGVLDWVDDRWVIWVGPGQSATDDSVFHRNPSDFRKIFNGAIPFHFHARAIDMSAVAGPGGTDLQAAEAHGAPALVLTSLSDDRLQVDWYRRGGLVVDLGEIEQ